jgi:hypothetical protein
MTVRDDLGHLGGAAGDGEPVDGNGGAEVVPAQRVHGHEIRRGGGLEGVVERGHDELLDMGVHRGPDAGQSEDAGVDVGLRGGLVVSVIGCGRREEAELARLEVAFLGPRRRDDDLVRARIILPADRHVPAVAVLDIDEQRSAADGLEEPQELVADPPFRRAHRPSSRRRRASRRAFVGRPSSSQPRTR